LFVLNVLEYLGGGGTVLGEEIVRPGQTVALESPAPGKRLDVRTPGGEITRLQPDSDGEASFTSTGELGIYEVLVDGQVVRYFAVNLFQASESDIRPVKDIRIGHVEVAARANWEVGRREIWKLLLLAGLVVLCVEWYTYNRRVAW
jgi:hypothetical protein